MSVIKEIPVFLSKSCMENLLLFEFPNRPKQNPIQESAVIDCKYKPRFHHAELSLSLNTTSANYERHRGQELGRLATDQFPRGLYDRQLMRSLPNSEAPQQQQQRHLHHRRSGAVARFHADGASLVLCPMPAAGRLVMQPVLEHLDAAAAAGRQAEAVVSDDPAAVEAKAVTLRFARQETPEARARREQSYRACQRLLDQDPWLKCRWLDDSTDVAAADPLLGSLDPTTAFASMETDEAEAEKSAEFSCGVGATDYLTRLCPPMPSSNATEDPTSLMPPTSSTNSTVAAAGSTSVSLARLRAMPCEERLRALFKSACVLRWTQLVDLLKQCGMTHVALTESLTQIHGHLNDLACLVRGLWVVKSEILFPPGTVSMYSGVPAEVMCRGRDYILCRFVHGRTVTRKEVASLVKIPSEEISQILTRISRGVRHTAGGDFSESKAPKMRLAFISDEDTEYVRRNPDVVKKAQYYWEAKWKLLSEQLKLDRSYRSFRPTSASAESVGSRRSRTRSARYSTSSSDYSGEGTVSDSSLSSASSLGHHRPPRQYHHHHQLGAAAARRRQKHQQQLASYRRRQCVSMCEVAPDLAAAASGSSNNPHAPTPPTLPPPTPTAVASTSSVSVAEVAVGEDLNSRIGKFLRAKLLDRNVAALDELIRFCRAEAAGTCEFQRLPSAEDACRRLFDSAAESHGIFILPGGGTSARLYALPPLDSQPHAAHRRELLDALKTGASQVTLSQLRARFQSAGLEAMTETGLKSLVKDYCTFKGKAYYAKGYQHN